MSTIAFSKPSLGTLEVPTKNLMGVFQPHQVTIERAAPEILHDALANPIGSPRLGDLAASGQRVLILLDDYTRMTPAHLILPLVLRELHEAGVRERDITFLMATGTHRAMTEAEIARKVGGEIAARYRMVNHKWNDPNQMVSLGSTASGIEIEVNRLALESDLIVGLGHIVPHRVAGYSGGGKIVQPGICGAATTGQTHWLTAVTPGRQVLGVVENPARQAIDAVALQVGLKFIVNTVQDAEARVVSAFAGDPVAAHRAGAADARSVFGAKMPAEADIVVIEAYPSDFDMWQASKAIYSSELAVREGGTVILLADLPEGIANQHPEVEANGYLPIARVKELVADGALKDLTAASHIAHVGLTTQDWAHCILVSSGVGPQRAAGINFEWAETPQRALAMALDRYGPGASVAILKHGSELLPIIPAS